MLYASRAIAKNAVRCWPPQAQRELEASRADQSGQRRNGRLPLTGLIRADHALRDTRPGGQVHLGQASLLARLAEQGSCGGRFHAIGIADRHQPYIWVRVALQDQSEWQIEWQRTLAWACPALVAACLRSCTGTDLPAAAAEPQTDTWVRRRSTVRFRKGGSQFRELFRKCDRRQRDPNLPPGGSFLMSPARRPRP
jgi:hypothetical protein